MFYKQNPKLMRFKYLYLSYFLLLINFSLVFTQPSQFKAHGIGGGGSFYSPAVNPNNSKEIFMVPDMSDLYHSLDGGNSWSVVSFTSFVADPSKSPAVQFTETPNLLYSTTTNWVTENTLTVKSTDGGTTWKPITTDPTSGNGVWITIANLQNANQVIVSDYNNLYFSNDEGRTFINNGKAFCFNISLFI